MNNNYTSFEEVSNKIDELNTLKYSHQSINKSIQSLLEDTS